MAMAMRMTMTVTVAMTITITMNTAVVFIGMPEICCNKFAHIPEDVLRASLAVCSLSSH